MSKETIIPKDESHWLELRTKVLTSTDIAALFGISPYATNFEIWHRKKNNFSVDFQQTDRSIWGLRLQSTIAEGIAKDEGWTIRPMNEFITDNELRIGSSFDFSIGEEGILEIKNVDSLIFKENWTEDESGNLEGPPHIELQLQFQLLLSGRQFAYIGALIGGNRIALIKRLPDERIISAIKQKVAAFWTSIDANQPPSPDFARDASFISRLYSYAEPEKFFDARGDENIATIAQEHRELGEQIEKAKMRRDAIKAQLLMQIGDAEKVLADGFSISAGLVGPAHIEYDREGYRQFRINWPRGKK